MIDSNDTLHLVVRSTEDHPNSGYKLSYLRAVKTGGNWIWEDDHTSLVLPDHTPYSNWYHKLTIDREDNLYLSYSYYAHNLNGAELVEYNSKWPGEPSNGSLPYFAHDPVLLTSQDSGGTWSYATTSSFAVPEPSSQLLCFWAAAQFAFRFRR